MKLKKYITSIAIIACTLGLTVGCSSSEVKIQKLIK